MDADLSTPLSSLQQLLEHFLKTPHLDVLIGSRRMPKSHILIPQGLIRRFLGKTFNLILKAAGLTKWNDTQCGCKLFRHDTAKKIFSHTSIEGFGFDVELLLIAEHLGYHIQEAPVDWADSKKSRFRILHDGIETFHDIWLLKKKKKLLCSSRLSSPMTL